MILDHGGEIKIPWKDKDVGEWYEHWMSLSKNRDGKYCVHVAPHEWHDKNTLEEALEIFLKTCDNIGAIQQYIFIKEQILDPDFLEVDGVRELVQKEIERRKNEKAS